MFNFYNSFYLFFATLTSCKLYFLLCFHHFKCTIDLLFNIYREKLVLHYEMLLFSKYVFFRTTYLHSNNFIQYYDKKGDNPCGFNVFFKPCNTILYL